MTNRAPNAELALLVDDMIAAIERSKVLESENISAMVKAGPGPTWLVGYMFGWYERATGRPYPPLGVNDHGQQT